MRKLRTFPHRKYKITTVNRKSHITQLASQPEHDRERDREMKTTCDFHRRLRKFHRPLQLLTQTIARNDTIIVIESNIQLSVD